MANIRITKVFNLEIAHALWNYKGKCKNIHGHTYKLFVTVIGCPLNKKNHNYDGMVIDFYKLKKLIKKQIVDKYDHSIIINKNAPYKKFEGIEQMFDKCILVDYQPSCENIILDFVDKIKKVLPDNLKLYSVKLQETDTSYAEWNCMDN